MRHVGSIVILAEQDDIVASPRAWRIGPDTRYPGAASSDACADDRGKVARQRGANRSADESQYVSGDTDDAVRQKYERESDNSRAAPAFACLSRHNAERDEDLANRHACYPFATKHFFTTAAVKLGLTRVIQLAECDFFPRTAHSHWGGTDLRQLPTGFRTAARHFVCAADHFSRRAPTFAYRGDKMHFADQQNQRLRSG